MTVTVFRKDTDIQISYPNCEIKYEDNFNTEYQGRDGDKGYTIVVDNYSLPEDRRGTVYESLFNEDKGEWEEYDWFWFFQDKMSVV